MDKERFSEACRIVLEEERQKKGIGTLGEKTLHAVLKHYYEPFESNQEVLVGEYVADIVGEAGIIEIQTRSFERLNRKLEAFLTVCPVTVVYPIPRMKWLSWIDTDNGDITPERKSPKIGTYCDSFWELNKIKSHLSHPNLSVHLLLIDLKEYRYLNGWSKDKKRGSHRCDRIPVGLADELVLSHPQDYLRLLPPALEEPFTVKQLMKAARISQRSAQSGITLLRYLRQISHVGNIGRAYLYQRSIGKENTKK